MDRYEDRWERALPWGFKTITCENGDYCHALLNETRVGEVLEYLCKPISTSNDTQGVCTCSTRQMRIGYNCDQLTLFSYIGCVIAFLVLVANVSEMVNEIRFLVSTRHEKRNAAYFAVLAATLAAFTGSTWMFGKILRFLTYSKTVHTVGINLINSFSVPAGLLFVLGQNSMVSLAWARVVHAFQLKKKKKSTFSFELFEKFIYLYMISVSVGMLILNSTRSYFFATLLSVGSMIPFSVGFCVTGARLHTMLETSSTRQSNTGSTTSSIWNCCSNGTPPPTISSTGKSETAGSRAVAAIKRYTYRIALANLACISTMAFFTISDGIPLNSAQSDAFHTDVVSEQMMGLAIWYASHNIIGYVKSTKKRKRSANGKVGPGATDDSVQSSETTTGSSIATNEPLQDSKIVSKVSKTRVTKTQRKPTTAWSQRPNGQTLDQLESLGDMKTQVTNFSDS